MLYLIIFLAGMWGLPLIYNGTLPVAGAVAVGIAGAVTFAVAGSVAGAGAFAVAVSIAVAGAGAVAVAIAIAIAVGIAGAGASAKSHKTKFIFLCGVILLYGSACFVMPLTGLLYHKISAWGPALMAYTLIPLLNVGFDWASVGVTRLCLEKSMAGSTWRVRTIWSICDFLLALCLMLGLCMVMIVGLEAYNAAFQAGGHLIPDGGPYRPAPIAAQIESIKTNPWGAGNYWIYFALFTTLLPTAIHAFIWLFSWIGAPYRLDKLVGTYITEDGVARGGNDRMVCAGILAGQWVIATAILFGLILLGPGIVLKIAPQIGGIFLAFIEHIFEFSQRVFGTA